MANIFSKVLLPDGFITDKDLQVAYGSMSGNQASAAAKANGNSVSGIGRKRERRD